MAKPQVPEKNKLPTLADPSLDAIDFGDYNRRRELIFNKAQQAVQTRFTASNAKYDLSVEDVAIQDQDKPISLKEQKAAILGGKTLHKPLRGRLVLRDKAGNIIDKGSRRTLMNVPYLTDRGTFIRNGNESVVINQFRLRPGVYHRKTVDGLFESMFNVEAGSGQQFKMKFDPQSAQFFMEAGGRKMALYPILQAIGVDDATLEKAWGVDILEKNKHTNGTRALNTAREIFLKGKFAAQQPKVINDETEVTKTDTVDGKTSLG
jgi:DNA-directed RNA polymerase beta subunit